MNLEPGKLNWKAVLELAPAIRDSDLMECHNGDPYNSLLYGATNGGDAWAALSPSRILGAYGYRKDTGKIWSLWRDLSRAESIAVLKHTPLWVSLMVRQSGLPFLWNYVHTANELAVGWLKASRCFDINWHAAPMGEAGLPAYYFRTKANT